MDTGHSPDMRENVTVTVVERISKPLLVLFSAVAIGFLLLSLGRLTFGGWHAERKEQAAVAAFRQIRAAMNAYGHCVPLAPYPDLWVPDLRALYPKHLDDLSLFVSPYHPKAAMLRHKMAKCLNQAEPDWERIHRIAAQSVVYTGYILQLEADLEAFVRAGMPRSGEDVEQEGYKVYARRPGVERLLSGTEGYLRADRFGRLRGHGRFDSSGFVLFMEQPALSDHRPARGMLLATGWNIEFIPEGYGFPALPSVAKAFPVPPLEQE